MFSCKCFAFLVVLEFLFLHSCVSYYISVVEPCVCTMRTAYILDLPLNYFKSLFMLFQFIIVSLKDGMFNNANVLFRTKFVDGMSTVSRTTPEVSRK